jgi:EAL domain-containing protein (putative c-di-GMP-specific phosphodiesterase class I)
MAPADRGLCVPEIELAPALPTFDSSASLDLVPASSPSGWPSLLASVLDDRRRIGVHFQPIVDLQRGTVAGFEALARFRTQPAHGPDRWFAAATGLNRDAELEAAVVARVLEARSLVPPNCFLSLNVGPRALLDDRVHGMLREAGPLGGIVIEVTEQAAVDDYDALRRRLDPLREAGAHLAVDDAGAGYASLSHIAHLRPDFIKVDRALVRDIDRDPAKAAVMETLGTFGSRIDAWVVAEGIERAGELQRLMQLDVPLGQGYRLGRPAAHMGALAPEAMALRGRVERRTAGSGLGPLSEPAPSVPPGSRTETVARLFARDPDAEVVVLVDEHQRPVGVHLRPTFERGERPLPAPLCVLAMARPADVARRAMTRDAPRRFDPVVVVDDLGRLRGVVRIERLVEALAA